MKLLTLLLIVFGSVSAVAQTVTRLTDQVRLFYNSSQPTDFTNLTPQKVLFSATPTGRNGSAPYVTNGTAAGTLQLLPSLPTDHGVAGPYTILGTQAYFFTSSPSAASSFWKTDGTPAGTTLVSASIPPNLHSLAIMNGAFIAIGAAPSGEGSVIWKSDGTPAGTSTVHTTSPQLRFTSGKLIGGTYLIAATFITGQGRQDAIWKSNGTNAGTVLVKTLSNVDGGNTTYDQFPAELTEFGGFTYFLAMEYANVSGQDYQRSVLWRTDGSGAGTVRIGAPGPLFGAMFSFGGSLFMEKDGAVDLGGSVSPPLIMKSDGTLAGTSTAFFGSGYSSMSRVAMFGGHVYYNLYYSNFLLPASSKYSHLCRMSSAGTMQFLANLPSSSNFSGTSLSFAIKISSQPTALYLRIVGAVADVWKITGTTVASIQRLGSGAVASDAFIDGDMIGYGDNFTSGPEIYSSRNGITLIVDLSTGVSSSDPNISGFINLPRASLGNLLLFSGQDPVNGNEIWRSDGTIPGTYMLANASSGQFSSSISQIIPGGNSAWIVLSRSDIPTETYDAVQLWKTDGTTPGTSFVRQVPSGTNWYSFVTDGSRLVAHVGNSPNPDSIVVIDGPGTGNVLGSGNLGSRLLQASGSFWWTEATSSLPVLKRSDGSTNPAIAMAPPAGHRFQTLEIAFGNGVIGTTSSKSAPEYSYDDLIHIVWFRPDGPVILHTTEDSGYNKGFSVFAGRLYFTRSSFPTQDSLYSSDGTPGGSILLDTAYEIGGNSNGTLTEHAGHLYYPVKATSSSTTTQIHRTAGTVATTGTTSIQIPTSLSSMVSAGGWLLYAYYIYDEVTGGLIAPVLYTAGMQDGQVIAAMNADDLQFYSSQPDLRPRNDGLAFFSRFEAANGDELWKVQLPQPPAITPYDSWAQNKNLSGNNAQPLVDADNDGVENIIEFYTGTHPADRASVFRPTFAPFTVGGPVFQGITIPRMSDTGLTLTVQSSVDLVNWNTDITISPSGTLTNGSFKRTAIESRIGTNPEVIRFGVIPRNTYPKVFVRYRIAQ